MIVAPSEEVISEAVKLLQEGSVIGLPTETVYGLAASIYSDEGLNKIFSLKKRPKTNPLIVHTHSVDGVLSVGEPRSSKFFLQLSEFWPGALTLVIPSKANVSPLITANQPSIAVRIPAHPVALTLLDELGSPVAAPSANKSTGVSPTEAIHVIEELGESIFVIDGGPCSVGLESTIVSLLEDTPRILRHGGIPAEEIAEKLSIPLNSLLLEGKGKAPGQENLHYAPKTPLSILPKDFSPSGNIGVLTFSLTPPKGVKSKRIDNPKNFYPTLREFDKLGLDRIYIEEPKESGLGRALRERILKASH